MPAVRLLNLAALFPGVEKKEAGRAPARWPSLRRAPYFRLNLHHNTVP